MKQLPDSKTFSGTEPSGTVPEAWDTEDFGKIKNEGGARARGNIRKK